MTSPLATLDLSYQEVAHDKAVETRRELINAYDRIDSLQDALKDLLGLIQLLSHNSDIPQSVRDDMMNSYRVVDAEELLR